MSHARTRPGPTRITAALLIVALLAGGCTSTKTRRLSRFDTGGDPSPVLRPAPESGVYKVKYAGPAGHDLHSVGGTGRIVGEGEPLGFTTAPDGRVLALVGDEQIPLDHLPPAARYCVWSFKERRPTQFTREVGKATATAAVVTATAALGTGLLVSEIYLNSLDDENCERAEGRRGRRGYR